MANFIITTQKPVNNELQASKSKTAGKGMEDAFDSLMASKAVGTIRSVGGQDSRRRNNHQQQQSHQTREPQSKTPRQIAIQLPRHGTQSVQLTDCAPRPLIQRKMQQNSTGERGRQKQQKKAKDLKGSVQKSNSTLSLEVGSSDVQAVSTTFESGLGSLFDDLKLTDQNFDEPALLADDQSIFDMLGCHENLQLKQQLPVAVPKNQLQYQAQAEQVIDADYNSAPIVNTLEPVIDEDQLLEAALAKTNDHYPEGSVGRALREGQISQEALQKLFAQWKAHRSHQNKLNRQGRIIPVPHTKTFAAFVPDIAVDNPLQGGESSEDETSQSSGQGSEAAEKIYEYIKAQIIESVWVSKSPHGLAEGVVVLLSGDLVGGSQFLLRKIQDTIEVSFYIVNESFYTLAQGFKDNLIEAIEKKCGAESVQIRYHRLESQPYLAPDEEDSDLWADH